MSGINPGGYALGTAMGGPAVGVALALATGGGGGNRPPDDDPGCFGYVVALLTFVCVAGIIVLALVQP